MHPLVATPIHHGYTWTLASRLGQMLQMCEQRFGKRDRTYTLLGIEFGETGPFIWYPGNCQNVIIQLSLSSQKDETCALYELSHECVHLLSPTGKKNANVLEEGLATYFSWVYGAEILKKDFKSKTQNEAYLEAALLVEELLKGNPDFFIEARKIQNCISYIDAEVFEQVAHSLNPHQVRFLVQKFN